MCSKTVDLLLVLVCLEICCQLSCEALPHEVVHVAVGQKTSLPCSVEISGNIHVEWLDPQQTLLTFDETVSTQDQRFKIRHPYLKDWYLDISNVRHSDAGNYTCRIGPVPEINRFVELVVTNPPEITKRSGEGTYAVNSTVTLTCEARGVPQPTITWHRLNEHRRKIDLNTEGSTYVIESVMWSNAGLYECYAVNGVAPIAMAALQVEVLFAPIVRVPYREVIQEEDRWTQLTCIIIANPTPNVYWMRNEKRIEDSANLRVQKDTSGGRYHVTLRLTLEQLRTSDYGQYKCFAENEYGTDQGALILRGQDNKKPLLVSAPKDSLAAVGEDTLMNCSILNLPKGHSVIWWHTSSTNETRKLFESHHGAKNSKKVTDRANVGADRPSRVFDAVKHEIVGQYNLIIRKTNFSDQGVYVCEITGHENHSATLKVIENHNPSSICNEQKQTSPLMNMTLIIAAIVVFLVLVIAIVVVVIVYKMLLKRAEKDSSRPVELSPKFTKTDQS